MAPIVSTTPRGNVLPSNWRTLDIRSWCSPHGSSQAQAPTQEPQVRDVRQHEQSTGQRTPDIQEPHPTPAASAGPDQGGGPHPIIGTLTSKLARLLVSSGGTTSRLAAPPEQGRDIRPSHAGVVVAQPNNDEQRHGPVVRKSLTTGLTYVILML
jgi:hypothetical protein